VLGAVRVTTGTRNHAGYRRLTPMMPLPRGCIGKKLVRLAGEPSRFVSFLRCPHDLRCGSRRKMVRDRWCLKVWGNRLIHRDRIRNAMAHDRLATDALRQGLSVSIALLRLVPGSKHLRVPIDLPRQSRGTRSTTLSSRVGLERAQGVVDGLELVLGIEGTEVTPLPKGISQPTRKGRVRKRSTGTTLDGQRTRVLQTRM